MVQRMTILRAERAAKGVCAYCGLLPIVSARSCDPCKKKRTANADKNRQRCVIKKLCYKCRWPNNNPNSEICFPCTESMRLASREFRKTNKQLVVAHFGGKCQECGEDDIRCMSLDHVDNNGNIEHVTKTTGKRVITPVWYSRLARLIQSGKPIETNLRLLCFNCHAKKDLCPWWLKDET